MGLSFKTKKILIKMYLKGSSHCGTAETNPTRILEDAGSIPDLPQWDRGPMLP